MKVIIGIDVGGSTTKIVGFDENHKLIEPMFVRANDPMTSVYGAFGKFTNINKIGLSDISKIMVTGVGSSFIVDSIYGLECNHIPEFTCVGKGGLFISELERAIVVSMGTGTALVYAQDGKEEQYLGGTGVGGGTIMGLSKKILRLDNIDHIMEVAESGDLSNVDLRISDITSKEILPNNMTAANFGKLSDLASNNDIALGIMNLVFETIGMMAIFAARQKDTKDIVLTGNLTNIPWSKVKFAELSSLFGVNFVIPDRSQFGPVIGAALSGF